ncbi:unnamed protein product [Peronospora destructor]|uniref:Uncharacterized protein n=1 Tax=Peronospora destructor TaxID=86335 RepID=A0AAV0TEM5_9STRA|nr:unnamed protein product [Peronospora destructor]
MAVSTPCLSPRPPSGNLPTQRLQDECAALRLEVDKLMHRLAQERAARTTLENEAQLRELELRNVQQRSAHADQQTRDKQMALEKELEDEAAMHRLAVLGRNAATQKNTTLAAELKTMETKWKKELEKKETAIAKAELAVDEIQRLKFDKDQIVRRTESGAKRLHELWHQIAREHQVKVEALKQKLLTAQPLSSGAEVTATECQEKIAKLEKELRATWEEKTTLQEQLSAATRSRSSKQKELDRLKETSWGNERHQTALVQKLKSECKLYAQQEEATMKERDVAVLAAHKAEEALNRKTEELLALKTEFTGLLQKHTALVAQFKQSAREREAQLVKCTQKLRDGKRYAEELAMLRRKEISGYKRVIDSVNTRLTEAQELSESAQSIAWSLPQDARKAKTSLCIYRH